jgi:hypothetical protein
MATSDSEPRPAIEPTVGSKASKDYYFLVSVPFFPSTPHDPAFHGRTLRYTGSGHSDIVLTQGKPVFLRFYLDVLPTTDAISSPPLRRRGKQMAVSSKADAKTFGFAIGDGKGRLGTPNCGENSPYKDEHPLPGIIAVEMHPGRGDEGFYFEQQAHSIVHDAVLKWAPEGQEGREWRGFILRESPGELFKGNPRLFWDGGEGELLQEGEGWARINLVREFL